MIKKLKIGNLLDIYGNLLTEKQFEIMSSYYYYDLSLGEIAEQSGITRQAVRDTIKSSEKSLEKFEGAVGMLKMREELSLLVNGSNEKDALEDGIRQLLIGS